MRAYSEPSKNFAVTAAEMYSQRHCGTTARATADASVPGKDRHLDRVCVFVMAFDAVPDVPVVVSNDLAPLVAAVGTVSRSVTAGAHDEDRQKLAEWF